MEKYVYTKEPGILMDALFLLKLHFNGEEAYNEYRNDSFFEESDIAYFNLMKDKLSDVSEKLLPFFYYRAEDDMGTPLISYLQTNWAEIADSGDSVIDGLYALLRDYTRFRDFICNHFLSGKHVLYSANRADSSFSWVLNSDYPNDLKVYLLHFMLSPEAETENLIAHLKTTVEVCNTIYAQHEAEIVCGFGAYNGMLVRDIYTAHYPNASERETLYYTVCCVLSKTLFTRKHKDTLLLFIGVEHKNYSLTDRANSDIDIAELARCLNDEQRIKILTMLRGKEMYCAEIARELGLKNNSTIYHLMMMKKCKLLTVKSYGKKILYRLNISYLLKVHSWIGKLILEEASNENEMGNTDD